jgi:nitric oxide reductase activation protein
MQPKKEEPDQQDQSQKKAAQQNDRMRQQEVQIIQRKLQALRSAPKGTDPSITAGYEPKGNVLDEISRSSKMSLEDYMMIKKTVVV